MFPIAAVGIGAALAYAVTQGPRNTIRMTGPDGQQYEMQNLPNKEKAVDHALQTLPNARAHWFRPAHHDLHAQHPERFAEVLVSNLKNGFLA